MDKVIKGLLEGDCVINDDNIKWILLEIPRLIEEMGETYGDRGFTNIMEIYLEACIYLGHYIRPYHTLKSLDDFTDKLNGEMYIGKYFSIAEDRYYSVHTLGQAQQFYGKALTELLQAMKAQENSKIEEGCRYFEHSMELLKQLNSESFKDKEHVILDLYFTFVTLLAVLERKEEFYYYYKNIFTWNLDFSDEICHMLFYQMEIMLLTLEKQYQVALLIYQRFFETENISYIPTIGEFIITCYKQTGNKQEYERFLKKAYKLELEKYEKMDEHVLDSLLRNRKNLTLDIYIGSFKQDFNVIGGKPAVYKFN